MGKSTLATATAVRAARAGLRVLIVSTDQAHSIGDVLGTAITPTGLREPTRVLAEDADAGGGFLDALALDTLALLEARWREIACLLSGRFPESDVGTLPPKSFRPSRESRRCLDCTRSASLLPRGVGSRRRRLRLHRGRAAHADAARHVRPVPGAGLAAASPVVRRGRDAHSAAVVGLAERIGAGTEQLSALLTDGSRVSAHLVLTAERVVAAEAVRTLGALALMGVRVDELIVNQILVQDDSYEYRNLPEHPAFDWYAERIYDQQAVLEELDTTIGDVQLVLVPHLAGEPIGAKALAELLECARRRDGSPPPGRCGRWWTRIRIWARSHLPVTARVAAGRLRCVDVGPGRRRSDHRRRWTSAPGSVGVRPAAMRRDGRAVAGQRADGAFSTKSGGVAGVSGAHPDLGPELRQLAQAILDRLDPAVRSAAAMAPAAELSRPGQMSAGVVPGVCAGGPGERRAASAADGHRRTQRGAARGDPRDGRRPRHDARTRQPPEGPEPAGPGPGRYQHIPVTVEE